MLILYGLSALALLLQAAPAADPPAASPAMIVARTNLSRIKTKPVFQSSPDPDSPPEARTSGEHGKVVIAGIIGADGHFTEPTVAVSSRSPLLDATALAAAAEARFKPALDAAGLALSVPQRISFKFDNAWSAGKGGGLPAYRCDQFARDDGWWTAHWPANAHDDLYYLVLGFSSVIKSRGADGSMDPAKFASVNKDFDAKWHAAAEACRRTPDKLFLDVLPDGALLGATVRR